MDWKIIEKERLANLLRKEKQFTYLLRVVDNDAMNRANRLLIDMEDITLLEEIKKDDDYWTAPFAEMPSKGYSVHTNTDELYKQTKIVNIKLE